MGNNKKITAVDLQTTFNAADDKTDLKALAQQAISVLAEQEAQTAAAQEQATSLTAENEELKTAAANHDQEISEAMAQVEELGKKLDMQEKTKDMPGVLVTAGGEAKLLIGNKFRISKSAGKIAGDYNAKQVAESQELLDYLASIKSGSLIDPVAATEGVTDNAEA